MACFQLVTVAGVVYETARPLFWGELQEVGLGIPQVRPKEKAIFEFRQAVIEVKVR